MIIYVIIVLFPNHHNDPRIWNTQWYNLNTKPSWTTKQLAKFHLIGVFNRIPVVPHKAVAEVSE